VKGEWIEVEQIQGAGTTREQQNYEIKDRNIKHDGDIEYQLTQTDFDGKSKVLKNFVVSVEGIDKTPTPSPNPVTNGEVNIEIFNKDQSEYHIVNLQGQTVANGDLNIGDNTIKLMNLPKGEYVMQIKNGKSQKFIVQ
jgi:hypothetical protein